ncbi:hypothetical protein BC941DRAFT_424231 [Chlamydoabsidia padenii]|nr:hypothetical protein BC941DRAFT_444095 [Chlamydoabsidia padenii]KAI8337976.1 hypothetical protein BC941DRAFT_424231 [Chlamydoabsidia padenii]
MTISSNHIPSYYAYYWSIHILLYTYRSEINIMNRLKQFYYYNNDDNNGIKKKRLYLCYSKTLLLVVVVLLFLLVQY